MTTCHQILPMVRDLSVPTGEARPVAFVVIGDLVALDLVGPLEAFTVARTHPLVSARNPYRVWIVSEAGGPTVTRSSLQIATEPYSVLSSDCIDTLIVIGCGGGRLPVMSEAFLAWLCARACEARRIC